MDESVDWLIGVALGGIAVAVMSYVTSERGPDPSHLKGLQERMSSGASLFAPFTLPPADDDQRAVHGLVRWANDGTLVVQTDTTRLRLSDEGLFEDGWRGLATLDEATQALARDVFHELRVGFDNAKVRRLQPGDLPGVHRIPGVNLYRIELPFDWAQDHWMVLGVGVHDGRLAHLAYTDATGRAVDWKGQALRATFRPVHWGVPLGPDMASNNSVPLAQLGGRTLFSNDPALVLVDLPHHEQVRRHALAFDAEASTGSQVRGSSSVVDVDLATVWCNTASEQGAHQARLVYRVATDDPSFTTLAEAQQADCTMQVGVEPKTVHTLDNAVEGTMTVKAQVGLPGAEPLWTDQVSIAHTGPGVIYGQPTLKGELPAGTDVAALEFTLELDMAVQCTAASGKGRLRSYVTGVSSPRLQWTCPVER